MGTLNFQKKKEDEWKLSTTDNFKWCSVRSILQVVGAVDDGKWPIHVDLSQVVKQVPTLKEMDKERAVREEILKKKERELRRKAAPMTWRWHYCARYSMKWMWRIAKMRKRRIWWGKSKRQDPPQLMPPRIVMAVQNIPQNLAGNIKTKLAHRLLPRWKKGTSFLSFAAYFISFKHNWHLHRMFSLYVCDLCFKHD